MKRILLSLLLFTFPVFFYAQTKTVNFSNTGAATFYVPAGVTSITMSAWGAGGGGGGSTVPVLSLQRAAAGGGGGAFAGGIYSMPAGVNINLSINVGSGGSGGVGANGQLGNSSFVAGYITAVGGEGGEANLAGGNASPVAGLGGKASSSTGQTKLDGSAGGEGQTLLPAITGAGGQGANNGGVGGASIGTLLGNSNGNIGSQPGGGGSGSKSSLLGSIGTGGSGGDGRVTLSYDCPVYNLTSTTSSIVNVCSGTASVIVVNGNLPFGLYTVAYHVNGVAQTPVSMNVTTIGTGSFVALGFTTLGNKNLVITSLTSGTRTDPNENCSSNITANNSTTVVTTSSGTAPVALAGTGATCNQITANWQAVSGTTYYAIDVSTDVNFGSFVGTYNALNVGNVLTYTITGLSNAVTYYYRVRAFSGTCISANSNTITYKPAVAPGNIILSAPSNIVCTGFTANWVAEANAATYLLDVSTVNNFASFVYNGFDVGNVTTYPITGLNPGQIYYYRVRAKNGCATSVTANAAIQNTTTLIIANAPQSDMLVQPTCLVPTGTLVLKGLPNRNDYTIVQSGTTSNTFTGNSSSDLTKYTITGLAPGTYNFTVSYPGSCASPQLLNVVVNPLVTNTYTIIGGWSNGATTENQNIVFADDFSSTGDLFSCSCKVNAGKKVTINSLHTLKIDNGLVVDNAVGTQLIFENNASLIQVNGVSNTGNITYKRIAPKIRQADFVYWSTPVNPQTLIGVSPLTASDKYYYNNAPGWIEIDRNSTMAIGKGYIIRGPENFSNTAKADYEASFVGVPNNGTYATPSLTVARYHLLGNPYPSALSVDDLTAGNSVLNGTVYLWTHNTGVDTSGSYGYNPADYASYNGTGSVATTGNASNINEKPTGFIGAGQAFFVSTRATGPVVFNNSMRRGGTNNSQFFKSTSKETAIEKNRVWLNMTNANGLFKQLLVGYIEGATNGYENRFDGITMDANSYLDFYSIMNSNKFVIQGRALPFTDTDLVPLGYRTTVAGEFIIAIDEVDGKMSDQKIYIEDKTTGVVHDLTQSNYTFKTETGTFTDRLILRYTGKTLGTGDFENIEDGILVSVKNKVINILSSKENIKEVTVYDVSGKQLFIKSKIGNTEFAIPNLIVGNQVLLVKVILENNNTITRKVIF